MTRELTDSDGRVHRPRVAMDGPLLWRGGKVVYWDWVAGHYYDPNTDMPIFDRDAEAYLMGGK